ncbi:MAG: plastocyanin/azurin family copper-binding protein [Candidatus Limnocylindrales bacterium]
MTFVHRTWRLGLVAAFLAIAAAAITPALGATIGVAISDKQFDPAQSVVAQGDTVTWTVAKAIGEPHTVTSGKPADADKGSVFNSQTGDPDLAKLKDVGGTFSFTFDKAGTYAYYCVVHQVEMTGVVVVLAPGQSPPPAASPGESHGGVPAENKLIGAAILIFTLVLLFGAAAVYRRMNPA